MSVSRLKTESELFQSIVIFTHKTLKIPSSSLSPFQFEKRMIKIRYETFYRQLLTC